MTVSNLYSDGTNTNITGIINPKNMVDQGSSQKDNHKNTDANNANDVISKNKDGQQTKFIDFSTFSSEDVTAYVVFKHFKYKRGRQDSHQDYVAKDDEGFFSELLGQIGNAITTTRKWDETDYKGAVILPLQSPILMEHQVNWDVFNSPLTGIGAPLLSAALKTGGNFLLGKAAGKIVGDNALGTLGKMQHVVGGTISTFSDTLGQYGANAIANSVGTIFNPDSELVLQGVGLRRHTFEFTLTPRNAKEQQMIKDAIRTFKLGMLPSKSGIKLLGSSSNLSYPDEWTIHFIDGRQKSIGKPLEIPHIPDCALTNIAVMYNPQGHKFHSDGSPVQYRISLLFEEHTTLTSDDIESGQY